MNWFGRMSLPRQLTSIVLSAIVTSTIVSLIALGYIITIEINQLTKENIEREVLLVSKQLNSQYQEILDKTELLSDIFVAQLEGLEVNFDEKTLVKNDPVPTASINGEVVNNNFALVDNYTKVTDATATIFIRNNDDFIRVSTSLRNLTNDRVFGTYLGRSHPAYNGLMRGDAYIGKAKLFGKNYMTKYAPVRQNGETIAVLYIGVAYDQILQGIEQQLARMQFGKDGYLFISDTQEEAKGQLLLHPSHKNDNLYKVYPSLKSQIDALFASAQGSINYELSDRNRIIAFRHVDGWNWLLAINIDANEHAEMIQNTIKSLSVATVLAAILLSLGIWYFIRKLLDPLRGVASSLERIGSGDLTVRMQCAHQGRSQNEIDKLKTNIGNMTLNLHKLIKSIQHSSDQLLTSADAISNTNAVLQSRSDEVNAESMQVSTAIEQMAMTVEDVARNSEEVSLTAVNSSDMAEQGNISVNEVETSIVKLSNSFHQAKETIAVVEKDTQGIGAVVDVINSIAEQTNLLALNAAIEAARAGESGRGFAVVADEVRELAQRTQQSTKEIARVVESLQTSTHEAVDNMQQGDELVTLSVEKMKASKLLLDNIFRSMEEVESRVASIASATSEQSVTSAQISASAITLKDTAGETAKQSEISEHHSSEVRQQAQQLQQELTAFKV